MTRMALGKILKAKWQFIAASILALAGALFGGIFGGLVGAFAGDSWWSSDLAMSAFQTTLVVGGACLGAVPGAVWLLCLRQKWVLPILSAGGCAALFPAYEAMKLRNESLASLYAGTVLLGFIAGILIWARSKKADRLNKAGL
ncbi:hypothetical protein HAHE_19700 [Haloferula helveola]|uniref:Uncharacterized protein n=1 Tax=Haloferula helveola TaxID=490095 RepID=A0ABN6H532_9BACT|nr:hypothetical protein HAHE_19700 [Haloferula helveola]